MKVPLFPRGRGPYGLHGFEAHDDVRAAGGLEGAERFVSEPEGGSDRPSPLSHAVDLAHDDVMALLHGGVAEHHRREEHALPADADYLHAVPHPFTSMHFVGQTLAHMPHPMHCFGSTTTAPPFFTSAGQAIVRRQV